MSKSKIIIDRLAKLIEEGLITSKDIGEEIKNSLNYKKESIINKFKPEFIATGNIGCITQIANGTKIPILHTVEVIDWYTGGPKPKILRKL